MSFIAARPDKQAGVIPDTIDGADDIVDKDGRLQGPIRRAFESAVGVTRDPEVLPDQQAITVGQFVEVIRLPKAAAPDADQVDIGISTKPQFIVISLIVSVEHHVGYPGATAKVNPPPIHKEIPAN